MVWFKHATPKFAFLMWVVMRGRLSTGDHLQGWSVAVDNSCVFCQAPIESVKHLYFECPFSRSIWEALMKGVLGDQYSVDWTDVIAMTNGNSLHKIQLFTLQYTLQAAVHSIWRERNRRKHGDKPSPPTLLVKLLDKTVRNKFTIIQKKGDTKYGGGLAYWFQTRQGDT